MRTDSLERALALGTAGLPARAAGRVEVLEPEAPPPVLERLHALVRKGYKPVIGTGTDTDVVELRHIGRAPDLLLHSDGRVEPLGGRIPRFKARVEAPQPFAADSIAEQLRFMKFLDSIPKASLRDRTRRFRPRSVYLPVVFAILLAIHLAFTAIIMDDDEQAVPPPVAESVQPPAGAHPAPAIEPPVPAAPVDAPAAPTANQ